MLVVSFHEAIFSLTGSAWEPWLEGRIWRPGPTGDNPYVRFSAQCFSLVCPLTIPVSPFTRAPEDLRALQALLARLDEG